MYPADTEKQLHLSEASFPLSFLLHFWSPPTPDGNILPFSCLMLHFVHKLDRNIIYLKCGAGAGDVQEIF